MRVLFLNRQSLNRVLSDEENLDGPLDDRPLDEKVVDPFPK